MLSLYKSDRTVINMGYGLYLYGIFPAPGPQGLHLQGLEQQPVDTHQIEEFVFLYSEAQQERYLASRRNLLGHERVLEQAMAQGYRTLLPVPFNRLIFQDWETVAAQFITPHRESLKHLFERLAGRREVSVKVIWDAVDEQQRMMAANPALSIERDRLEGQSLSMDQVIRFGQATEQAMQAHQESIVRVFQETLAPLALKVIENEAQTDTMIYNAAFLIPWDEEPTFGQRVEELDQQFEGRLRIRYNNFTAPYNFAQLDQLD